MIIQNTFKMADGCGEENENLGYYEAKCLVEIWTNEEIQRQLSVIGRSRICGRTLHQNVMTNASTNETA